MKILIAGGGTGGHLFPAVAVGEELHRQSLENDVLYVGASNGLEARWLPAHNLPHSLLQVRGWTGKSPLTRARALVEFASAVRRARQLIRDFGAQAVLGAGGYASAPVAVAAAISRVPLVLMEQNVRPGLANRMLARFARRICVGFEETADAFAPGKTLVTGNPIRFAAPASPSNGPIPQQILVLGGSSGAHRLNLGVLDALRICRKAVIKFSIVHQTGEADVGLVAEKYRAIDRAAQVVAFIDDIAGALRSATLLIARSGAMTVSEVALAGRPAVFVPYPFHRDRQQELNARVLERRGAARIVQDDDRLGENLAKQLEELVAAPEMLTAMGRQAASAAMPDAARTIARVCLEEARGGVR